MIASPPTQSVHPRRSTSLWTARSRWPKKSQMACATAPEPAAPAIDDPASSAPARSVASGIRSHPLSASETTDAPTTAQGCTTATPQPLRRRGCVSIVRHSYTDGGSELRPLACSVGRGSSGPARQGGLVMKYAIATLAFVGCVVASNAMAQSDDVKWINKCNAARPGISGTKQQKTMY